MSLTQTTSDNTENDIIYSTTDTFVRMFLTTEYLNVTDSGDNVNSNFSDANSTFLFHEPHKEYIFDRKDVRYVFITLYSLVFCFCFFGKWLFWLIAQNLLQLEFRSGNSEYILKNPKILIYSLKIKPKSVLRTKKVLTRFLSG